MVESFTLLRKNTNSIYIHHHVKIAILTVSQSLSPVRRIKTILLNNSLKKLVKRKHCRNELVGSRSIRMHL